MKTHELEKELGISKHTIFYYEKEGIVTPQRDDNGYRSYSQDDLQKNRTCSFDSIFFIYTFIYIT